MGWRKITKFKEKEKSLPVVRLDDDFEIEKLALGGTFKPSECQQVNKIAIIVPYRDRTNHLDTFLRHMHPYLQRQRLHYTIFVIEQSGP